VYVVIVNWNGWPDTLECLESVFVSSTPTYGSSSATTRPATAPSSGSSLAAGQLELRWRPAAPGGASPPAVRARFLRRPSPTPPEPRVGLDPRCAWSSSRPAPTRLRGGNKRRLRLALARDDFDYAWLLNNDTAVDPDALRQLVSRMRARPMPECAGRRCGSTSPHGVSGLRRRTYKPLVRHAHNIDRLRPGDDPVRIESRWPT